MNKLKLLLPSVALPTLLFCQTKYIGVSGSFLQQNQKFPSGFMQTTVNRTTNLNIRGEYGLVKNEKNMFGVALGLEYRRNRNQNNSSNEVFAQLGFSYRRFFTDFTLQPFLETGIHASVGQTATKQDFFSSRIPLKLGLMYPLRKQWHILGTIQVAGINYTKVGPGTETSFQIEGASGISVMFIKFLN